MTYTRSLVPFIYYLLSCQYRRFPSLTIATAKLYVLTWKQIYHAPVAETTKQTLYADDEVLTIPIKNDFEVNKNSCIWFTVYQLCNPDNLITWTLTNVRFRARTESFSILHLMHSVDMEGTRILLSCCTVARWPCGRVLTSYGCRWKKWSCVDGM